MTDESASDNGFDEHELLAELAQSTGSAIVGLDADGRVLSWNVGAQALFGYEADEAVGRPIEFVVAEPAIATLRGALACVRQGGHHPPVELEQRDKHGRRLISAVTLSPVLDGQGRLLAISYVGHDIGRRKEIESRLRDVNRTLERRIRTRTRHLELMRDIAEIGNSYLSVGEATRQALKMFCRAMGWPLGHALVRDRRRPATFVDIGIWHRDDGRRFDELVLALERRERTDDGGLLGRAVATREPVWVEDLRQVRDPLSGIDPAPMRAMLVLPVLAGRQVIAVLELFSPEVRPAASGHAESLKYFGMQIGRVFERAELERRLADAGLEEQRRLGRELHDTLGQQITAIGIMAQTLRNAVAGSRADEASLIEKVDRMLDAIHEAKQHTRAILAGLAPVDVDAGGLMHALEELARQTTTRFGMRCDLLCESDVAVEDTFTATQLYLLAKEAVHNAVKHSGGRAIVLRLDRHGRHARLQIEDDGAGCAGQQALDGGRGMHIMQHRARLIDAEMGIEPTDGGGTRVWVRFSPARP
jgi:PAS domain S-box-containing protein